METRRYEIDGMALEVPIHYDELSEMYIEDYSEYIENTVHTPSGFPVMFAGEDACKHASEESPGGCPDCGSCIHYLRAAEHTWIGICKNEHNKYANIKETKQ